MAASLSTETAVLGSRVDSVEDEQSDFRRRFVKIDEALSDGKALMAAINTKLAIIGWVGALMATTTVGILVKLLLEHK
jgi:hypothetical protein